MVENQEKSLCWNLYQNIFHLLDIIEFGTTLHRVKNLCLLVCIICVYSVYYMCICVLVCITRMCICVLVCMCMCIIFVVRFFLCFKIDLSFGDHFFIRQKFLLSEHSFEIWKQEIVANLENTMDVEAIWAPIHGFLHHFLWLEKYVFIVCIICVLVYIICVYVY